MYEGQMGTLQMSPKRYTDQHFIYSSASIIEAFRFSYMFLHVKIQSLSLYRKQRKYSFSCSSAGKLKHLQNANKHHLLQPQWAEKNSVCV